MIKTIVNFVLDFNFFSWFKSNLLDWGRSLSLYIKFNPYSTMCKDINQKLNFSLISWSEKGPWFPRIISPLFLDIHPSELEGTYYERWCHHPYDIWLVCVSAVDWWWWGYFQFQHELFSSLSHSPLDPELPMEGNLLNFKLLFPG